MAALAAPEVLADRELIAAPAEPEALGLPGRAAAVVLVLRVQAALAAVVASAARGSMRVVSAMAPLVVMRDKVAPVASAELRARRVRMLQRWSVALAARAATRAQRAKARRASAVWMEQACRAMAALAAPVVLAERAAIAALVARAALALQGRALVVVLVLRAPAALVASGAWAEPDGMRVVSATAPLVAMRAPVALVAPAELRARLARTPRRWSAALVGSAVTPVLRALARRVSAA